MVRLILSGKTLSALRDLSDVIDVDHFVLEPSSSRDTHIEAAQITLFKEAIAALETSQESPKVLEHSVLVKASRLALKMPRIQSFSPSASPYTLDSLLKGCYVYHEPLPKFARSPELEATLARIRRQQEEDEYQRMIVRNDTARAGILSARTEPSLVADEWREVNAHLSAMFNVGFSLVAVVVAAWWAAGTYTAIEVKVAMCSFFGMLIVAAEAFLYIRHFERQKEKDAEKRRRLRGKLTMDADNSLQPVYLQTRPKLGVVGFTSPMQSQSKNKDG